jgi:hypothetical protein
MAGFSGRCSVDSVTEAMEKSLERVAAEFEQEGLPTTGPMIAVYTKFLIKEGVFEYLLGYMIPESLILPTHDCRTVDLQEPYITSFDWNVWFT